MSDLIWLSADSLDFPSTQLAWDDPNGLLAAGGDLSVARLIAAYQQGIFPWFSDDQPILWWTPSPRAVLKPNQIHISKSLAKAIRKQSITITADHCFDRVIELCSQVPRTGQDGTWITAEMLAAYRQLHQQGHAHSVEVWQQQQLIGGLYGVHIGSVFFGESMFSLAPNGSKYALVALAQKCQQWQFPIIDCQVGNPYLFSMGAETMLRENFENTLLTATNAAFTGDWQTDWEIQLN